MRRNPTKIDEASPTDERVVLGKIIGFHGVKGWLKVHSETQPRENIVQYRQWLLGSRSGQEPANWQPVAVINGRRSGKNVIVQLEGIDSREQGEALLGRAIAVYRSAFPAPAENEVYWADIVGCRVEDLAGNVIGTVIRLFETGANDVMVVLDKRQDGERVGETEKEVLIPWIRPSVVTEVDLGSKCIVVDWDPDF